MTSTRNIALGIIAFVIIVIAIALVVNYTGKAGVGGNISNAQSPSKSLMALQLTDPPEVPAGTQSLVVSYSSVMVHTTGASATGWIRSDSSGQVNLLSLVNLTQTIATVNVPNDSRINMVRFNITSAEITVNGTTYNVTLPFKTINANVSGSQNASNSSSLLISISPTVVTILTNNSTVFVMVPSLNALIVPHGTTQSTIGVGSKVSLQENLRSRLEDIRPNITLSNATLSLSGNTTKFSVTVNNNENRSVVIKHIGISGNASVNVNASFINSYTQRIGSMAMDRIRNTICANVNFNSSINLSVQDMPMNGYGVGDVFNANVGQSGNVIVPVAIVNGMHGNTYAYGKDDKEIEGAFGLRYNNTMCTNPGFAGFEGMLKDKVLNVSYAQQMRQRDFKLFSFLVSSNGTIAVPYDVNEFNDVGYTIGPMQSHTFNFTGTVTAANMHIIITPVVGSSYVISVGGEEGASTSANVVAASG